LTFVVQTEGNPEAVAPAARAQLKALDAAIPAANIRTMRQMVSNASSARRFNMALLGFFAAAALFLTAIGIYGVVAFSASRRSREIGVRIALGAKRNDVLELILRQGMKPVVIGGLAGVAGSFAVSRALESQLYEISRFDFVTLAIATGTVFAAALVACGIPARRAANLDPIAALRAE
jgi:putative ABC transport system permease protein